MEQHKKLLFFLKLGNKDERAMREILQHPKWVFYSNPRPSG